MGSDQSCTYNYGHGPTITVDPPAKPEDTLEAYRTLILSGEHKRHDLGCMQRAEDEENWSAGRKMIWGSPTGGCPMWNSSTSGVRSLYGQDIAAAYDDYWAKLKVKHAKEARFTHDKFTGNLTTVEARFKAHAKESSNTEFEKNLYHCLRRNVRQPLRCKDDVDCYINHVKKNSSLCYRLAPPSKRKTKICHIELNPSRKPVPTDDVDEVPEFDFDTGAESEGGK